ncbi:amidohydrolase family protein [Desulfoluna sp.]|uniref:amidohydrolase family protein n=1 Tax=Desulfoluna sp. TaxID=2045199 RepID=UPI00260F2623|nr:amidohydrolase family protein [Desulfoluna sp.]
MIIDFHTHIFHDEVIHNRAPHLAEEPEFALLYESPKSMMIGADALIAVMDEGGVDKSVVFGFPWRDETRYRANNDAVIEAVRTYPDRLIGMACFDLGSPGAAAETTRCLKAGLQGVGELAFYKSGIDEEALDVMAPVMRLCQDADLPVIIHTNEPVGHYYPGKTPITLGQIYNLAARYPDNRIVLCHWGGGIFFFNLLKKQAKEVLKNLWFDTAASPYLFDPAIYEKAAELAGEDRILFGSDFPLLKPARYIKEINAHVTDEALKQKILGGNAAAVLRL